MKQRLMSLNDPLMLTKRSIIESIIDRLKNISQIEHSRHRSPVNCFVNILAGGNCLLPSAKETVDRNRLQSLASSLTRTHVIFRVNLISDERASEARLFVFCNSKHCRKEKPSLILHCHSTVGIYFIVCNYGSIVQTMVPCQRFQRAIAASSILTIFL
jgi:hypothetical protein